MATKLSEFDKNNVYEVVTHKKNAWFSAKLLRYLNDALTGMDIENFSVFWNNYPEHCKAILRYQGWPEEAIANKETEVLFYEDFSK